MMVALFGGVRRAAISVAELHAKRDLIGGDLMFLFPVIEVMSMATAVVLSLVPMKQTNLFIGQRGMPLLFLKL